MTGDVVNVFVTSDGRRLYGIEPAEKTEKNRHYIRVSMNNHTYIFPPGVDLKKVDKEFFNIDYLMEEQYYKDDFIPIIVSYTKGYGVEVADLTSSINTALKEGGGEALTISRDIKMFHMMAMRIKKSLSGSKIAYAFKRLVRSPYVLKVWLDKKIHVSLDDSVPLINADDVWTAGYQGEGMKIAILDTGIDKTHPSLDDLDDDPSTTDPKVIYEVSEVPGEDPMDYRGHGTHCAGIAAGTGGGTAYVGVAPQAYLMNVKVLNRYGWGYDSWIISGIEDAVTNGADVISMSLGGYAMSDDDPLAQAVNDAVDSGVVVAVAAGNSGRGDSLRTVESPGVAAKAITVGATDKSDNLAYFSSRGPTPEYNVKPDVVAPGVSITSSVPGGGWESWSGTSMATPHVAGAAALLKQALEGKLGALGIGYSPEYMKDLLVSTAVDLGMDVYHQGGGRIDVLAAYNSKLLIDPAVLSFGVVDAGSGVVTKDFYIYNIDSTSDVTINVVSLELVDIVTGTDYSSAVTIDWYDESDISISLPYTLSPGHYIRGKLKIDTDAVPKSVFSGKLFVSDGTSDNYHLIFGISVLNGVTVHVTDTSGGDASDVEVMAVKDNPVNDYDFSLNMGNDRTDSSGNAVFHLGDGTYYFLAIDENSHEEPYIVVSKVDISGNQIVELDESDAQPVTLVPNRDDVAVSSREVTLTLDLTDSLGYFASLASVLSFYPTRTYYLTSTDLLVKTFYQYYPEKDMIPSDLWVINTDSYYNVAFTEAGITTPKNYVVSEDELVYSNVSYYTAQVDREAARYIAWSLSTVWWGTAWSFDFDMVVPTRRVEAYRLTGDQMYPVELWRETWMDDTGYPAWDWNTEYFNSPPARAHEEHAMAYPLHTIVYGSKYWSNYVSLYIATSDSSSPDHRVWGDCSLGGGTVNYIKQDGTTISSGDDFCSAYYRGISQDDSSPHQYEISTTWSSGHDLSTEVDTHVILNYDPSNVDLEPPEYTISFSPEPDLESIISPGNVKITLNVLDWDNSVDSVTLSYSLDDGVTWNSVPLTQTSSDTWEGDLGSIADGTYISLRIHVSDTLGNTLDQDIIRAAYVGYPTGPSGTPFTLADYPAPFARDNTLDALMVVGATDKHGPFMWRGYTVDVIWGSLVTTKLGQYAEGSIGFDAMQDTDFASYDPSTGDVTIDWSKLKKSSIIAIGSPGVNLLALYYNETLPFKFLPKTIYSEITHNSYVRSSDGSYTYGLIALLKDHGKNILLVWGLGGNGTRAVSLVLEHQELFHDLLQGSAVVIKWTDLNGDKYPDVNDQYEVVESWSP